MSRLLVIEWRQARRDPSLWLPVAVLSLLLCAAAWNGARQIGRARDAIASVVAVEAARLAELRESAAQVALSGQFPESYALDGSHPGRVGIRDGARRAALTPGDFAAFAAGFTDVLPQSYLVTTASLHTRPDGYDLNSPAVHVNGRFDVSFIFVALVPLFAIALGFNVISSDRESGRLRLLMAQPVSLPRLIFARLAIRFAMLMAPAAVVVAALYAWTAAVSAEGLLRCLVLVAALGFYAALWLALCGALNTAGRGSIFNATAALAVYLMVVVFCPNATQAIAVQSHPLPDRLALVTTIREHNARIDTGIDAIAADYYREHPEVVVETVSPRNMERWFRLFPKNLELDRRLGPMIQAHDAARFAQSELVRRAANLVPPVALNEILEQWAGSDFARNRSFESQVKLFQSAWRDFFGPKVMGLVSLRPEDYADLPNFRFFEETTARFWRRALAPLASLFAISAAMAGALFLMLRLNRLGLD